MIHRLFCREEQWQLLKNNNVIPEEKKLFIPFETTCRKQTIPDS